MNQNVFVTGTGTDIGKTYVTAALIEALQANGSDTAYYKVAISGADSIPDSDAGYVKKHCDLEQSLESLVSYFYRDAVSPHLAAKWAARPVDAEMAVADFMSVALLHDTTVVEGSGGIICPLTVNRDGSVLMLEDVVKQMNLPVLVVADAGLGTINATVLTIEHLRAGGHEIMGVILNRFDAENEMHTDNLAMIEKLADISVVATVPENGALQIRKEFLGLAADESNQ